MRWLLVLLFLGGIAVVLLNMPNGKERRELNEVREQMGTAVPSHQAAEGTKSSAPEPPNPGEELRRGHISDWNRALPSLRLVATEEMIFLSRKSDLKPADLMTCIDTTASSGSAQDEKVSEVAGLCIGMLQ